MTFFCTFVRQFDEPPPFSAAVSRNFPPAARGAWRERLKMIKYLCFRMQICRCGGIGRHKGLKIPRPKKRTGSTPVSGTITDTVIDTIVSVTVSAFLCSFYWKQGVFLNFATHFRLLFPWYCSLSRCADPVITTYCAFNSLNNRYSLYSR